jgi:hypothetical protein
MTNEEYARVAYTIIYILEAATNKAAGCETSEFSFIGKVSGIKKIQNYTNVRSFRNKLVHGPEDTEGLFKTFDDAPVYKVLSICSKYIGIAGRVPNLYTDIAEFGEYLRQQAKSS